MRDHHQVAGTTGTARLARPREVTPTRLADLGVVAVVEAPGWRDVEVTGVTHDSRQVRPGDLYVALPGSHTHGARFVAVAVEAGAVAVMTDADGARLVTAPATVPVIVVDYPRSQLGPVAAAVYGHPARDLLMLGVTGTNGKTTTAYLIDSCLRAAGHRTGLVGTVETRIGDERVASLHTTPEASDVHALLALMRERGVTACAMEVSSHAMSFGRVQGVVFDVVGFTNLSQDHLDFHGNLEDYFAAKAALFAPEHARRGVVDVTGAYGARLAAQAGIPTTTLATDAPAAGAPADWRVEPGGAASAAMLGPGGEKLELHVPLPGDFNVSNAALAAAMVVEAGLDPAEAVRGIADCLGVPGRMERVAPDPGARPGADPPAGVVDFAHTPDAIDNVLGALHPAGQLIAVIGAGGDRDRGKRPAMGAAAAARADVVVVTDDNPRSEDAAAIRAAVLAGASGVGAAEVIEAAGRRLAIRAALDRATGSDDTVIVLGKGHEQGQEVAGVVHPFDDRDVLRDELMQWARERGQ